MPDADKLDGHARDVALLVKKYTKEMDGSQATVTTDDTTQQTTQRTTSRSSPVTPCPEAIPAILQAFPDEATMQETQQQYTFTTASTSQGSADGSTQDEGTRASRGIRILVREDTSERLNNLPLPTSMSTVSEAATSSPPRSSATCSLPIASKRRNFVDFISPPNTKRRKALVPLQCYANNRHLGQFDYDSQEGIVHIYAKEGVKIQIHAASRDTDKGS